MEEMGVRWEELAQEVAELEIDVRNRDRVIRTKNAEIELLSRALAEYESDSRIAARYASLRLSVRA